jgi:hypothetical protein
VKYDWEEADRISDEIVDMLNSEIKKPGFNPIQAFAAQLLALKGYLSTAPHDKPPSLTVLELAIDEVLNDLLVSRRMA